MVNRDNAEINQLPHRTILLLWQPRQFTLEPPLPRYGTQTRIGSQGTHSLRDSADGNVSTIMLPGGLRTMISGIGVYYPNEEETQRAGIVPDIEVKPTIEGIRKGKDELIEKAIEIILSERL